MSNGPAGDIMQASQLARAMVMRWGMSDKVGNIDYAEAAEGYSGNTGGFSVSAHTKELIEEEVKRFIQEGYATRQVDPRRERHDEWERLAQGLLGIRDPDRRRDQAGDARRAAAAIERRRRAAAAPKAEPRNEPRCAAIPKTKPRKKPKAATGGLEPEPHRALIAPTGCDRPTTWRTVRERPNARFRELLRSRQPSARQAADRADDSALLAVLARHVC